MFFDPRFNQEHTFAHDGPLHLVPFNCKAFLNLLLLLSFMALTFLKQLFCQNVSTLHLSDLFFPTTRIRVTIFGKNTAWVCGVLYVSFRKHVTPGGPTNGDAECHPLGRVVTARSVCSHPLPSFPFLMFKWPQMVSGNPPDQSLDPFDRTSSSLW